MECELHLTCFLYHTNYTMLIYKRFFSPTAFTVPRDVHTLAAEALAALQSHITSCFYHEFFFMTRPDLYDVT